MQYWNESKTILLLSDGLDSRTLHHMYPTIPTITFDEPKESKRDYMKEQVWKLSEVYDHVMAGNHKPYDIDAPGAAVHYKKHAHFIVSPLEPLEKHEVIDLAITHGVDIKATTSCLRGSNPCYECAGCLELAVGWLDGIIPEGDVAVMLSGGLDSYVLATLLKRIHPTVTTISVNNYGSHVDADINIDMMEDIYGFGGPCGPMRSTVKVLTEMYDQVWTGETKNYDLPNAPYRPQKMNHPVYKAPWIEKTKDYVLRIADYYDIDVSHTISCSVAPWKEHCGECYGCKERGLAFSNLLSWQQIHGGR